MNPFQAHEPIVFSNHLQNINKQRNNRTRRSAPAASAENKIFGGEWHFGPPLGMKGKNKGLERIATTEKKRPL